MRVTVRQGDELIETTTEELAFRIKKKGKRIVTTNTIKFLMKCVYIVCQECNSRKAVTLFKKSSKLLCKQCYNKIRFNK